MLTGTRSAQTTKRTNFSEEGRKEKAAACSRRSSVPSIGDRGPRATADRGIASRGGDAAPQHVERLHPGEKHGPSVSPHGLTRTHTARGPARPMPTLGPMTATNTETVQAGQGWTTHCHLAQGFLAPPQRLAGHGTACKRSRRDEDQSA